MSLKNPVGHALKRARLERSLSVEALSRETKITADYIKAIEEGDFARVPADVYLKGFLQNLCEVLGLDPQQVLRDAQRKESNGIALASVLANEPKEQSNEAVVADPTQGRPSSLQPILRSKLLWGLVLACVLLGGLFVFLPNLRQKPQVIAIPNPQIPHVHDMFQQADRYSLKPNDSVHILDESIDMRFTVLATHSNGIDFSVGDDFQTNLQLGERLFLNLNHNEDNDLEVGLQNLDDHGAVVYLNVLNYEAKTIDYGSILSNAEPIVVGKEYTLFEYTEKTPIQVYIQAKQLPSIINYNKDGKRQDTISIDPNEKILIKADEHLEVIFGNYKSLLVMVNQKPIDLRLPENEKASITKIIKWIPDPSNETKYNLVVKDYVY